MLVIEVYNIQWCGIIYYDTHTGVLWCTYEYMQYCEYDFRKDYLLRSYLNFSHRPTFFVLLCIQEAKLTNRLSNSHWGLRPLDRLDRLEVLESAWVWQFKKIGSISTKQLSLWVQLKCTKWEFMFSDSG